jgi:hypothetical protein
MKVFDVVFISFLVSGFFTPALGNNKLVDLKKRKEAQAPTRVEATYL